MCQWAAVAFAGGARCKCTWDAIGPLKSGERRSDGHPDIGPPRQTFALANVHAPFLSKAPYKIGMAVDLCLSSFCLQKDIKKKFHGCDSARVYSYRGGIYGPICMGFMSQLHAL